MTTYRVTADLSGKKIIKKVEAKDEDDAWFIADGMYNWQLNNGLVEELPTRSEILARIQELETAGRELLDVCHCTNDCRPDDMSCATNKMLVALYGIENVSKYRAALLNNAPLEKE